MAATVLFGFGSAVLPSLAGLPFLPLAAAFAGCFLPASVFGVFFTSLKMWKQCEQTAFPSFCCSISVSSVTDLWHSGQLTLI